ncbi:hypothetical protein [Marinobacter sp. S6332]|uniref:hypothetical protein n=1 Tax=Marinobacter sp. S6332 TaxID=2926403 RepID=UPI001FF29138|nr:hypothetical protein [Marinobacter sp. S6332]MCK0165635.1 hypothetical protein [Marinobacter sp. S6332]
MKIETKTYKAIDIVELLERGPLIGHLPISRFSVKPIKNSVEIGGGGIYGILIDDKLKYIGKYQGKKHNWKKGSVLSDRWIKHIGTLTLLDRTLSFSKRAFGKIVSDAQELTPTNQFARELVNGLIQGNDELLTTDRGCSSTFERYAASKLFWPELSEVSPDWKAILNRVTLVYVKLTGNFTTETVRHLISLTESQLVEQIEPSVNYIAKRQNKDIEALSLDRTIGLFIDSLRRNQKHHGVVSKTQDTVCDGIEKTMPTGNETLKQPSDDFENPKFMENLEQAPAWAKKFISNIQDAVELRNDAFIEYTNTNNGDLRLRKIQNTSRGFLNVLTICWRPRLEALAINTALANSAIVRMGLKVSRQTKDRLNQQILITSDTEDVHDLSKLTQYMITEALETN